MARLLRPVLLLWLPLLLAGCIHPALLRMIEEGKHRQTEADPTTPTCLAFSPDGTTLAVGTASDTEGRVRLLDAASLQKKSEFSVPFGVTDVRFEPWGELVIVRGRSIYPPPWELPRLPLVALFRPGWVGGSPPPRCAVLQRAGIYEVQTGERWQTLADHFDRLLFVSSDGLAQASRSESDLLSGGTFEIKHLVPRKEGPKIIRLHEGDVEVLALARHDGPVAFLDEKSCVRLHDLIPHSDSEALPGGNLKNVRQLAFSADGKRLVALSDPREKPEGKDSFDQATVWDVAKCRIVRELRLPKGAPQDRLVLSDGGYLAVCGPQDGHSPRTTVFDLDTGDQLFPQASLRAVAFSPDGRRLAVLDESGQVKVIGLPARR
jgi:WD40 repeat protein